MRQIVCKTATNLWFISASVLLFCQTSWSSDLEESLSCENVPCVSASCLTFVSIAGYGSSLELPRGKYSAQIGFNETKFLCSVILDGDESYAGCESGHSPGDQTVVFEVRPGSAMLEIEVRGRPRLQSMNIEVRHEDDLILNMVNFQPRYKQVYVQPKCCDNFCWQSENISELKMTPLSE